ncbi:MAG: hypothetical protein ACQEXX_25030 [Bacillota bacterium]
MEMLSLPNLNISCFFSGNDLNDEFVFIPIKQKENDLVQWINNFFELEPHTHHKLDKTIINIIQKQPTLARVELFPLSFRYRQFPREHGDHFLTVFGASEHGFRVIDRFFGFKGNIDFETLYHSLSVRETLRFTEVLTLRCLDDIHTPKNSDVAREHLRFVWAEQLCRYIEENDSFTTKPNIKTGYPAIEQFVDNFDEIISTMILETRGSAEAWRLLVRRMNHGFTYQREGIINYLKVHSKWLVGPLHELLNHLTKSLLLWKRLSYVLLKCQLQRVPIDKAKNHVIHILPQLLESELELVRIIKRIRRQFQ